MAEGTTVFVKWKTEEFSVTIEGGHTLLHLKNEIMAKTKVQPHRQKLMGIKYNTQLPDSEITIASLKLRRNQKILVMGTPDESMFEQKEEDDTVENDLDVIEGENVAVKDQAVYLEKVQNRITSYTPVVLNKPREGKKLLVLDVDFTFFDHKSTAASPLSLRRPYIETMLEAVYPYYDIIIWSASSMRWIEEKMKLLQLVPGNNYKITAYVDYGAMITVHTDSYGVINTKPLAVIWGIFSGSYTQENTIMKLSDESIKCMSASTSNFYAQGLRIKAFRDGPTVGRDDKIKDLPTFASLNHSKWEEYLKENRK